MVKKKLISIIITCLIVGGVVAGGYYGYKKLSKGNTTTTAASYITVSARKMNLQVNVQGTGTAFAAVTKDIVSNNNGNVKDLSLKVGDTVKKGSKICVVDSDQINENVNKAESNLEKQKLQASKAKTSDDIELQNLNINDAQRDLDSAIDARDKMTITSPIDGVITAINCNNGDNVQMGKAIATIIDTKSIKVKVTVDELDIAKVKKGQKAEIKFGAIKDKVYEGTVEDISQVGVTTNNVTTYDVVVSIKDPTGVLIGMNANVNILTQSKNDALTIPAEALIERNGKKYVRVSSGDNQGNSQGNSQGNNQWNSKLGGRASGGGKLVEITTGIENENYIEVVSGVTDGEKLLVQLPQTNSNTTNTRNNFRGSFGGNMGGGNMGEGRMQAPTGNGGR